LYQCCRVIIFLIIYSSWGATLVWVRHSFVKYVTSFNLVCIDCCGIIAIDSGRDSSLCQMEVEIQ